MAAERDGKDEKNEKDGSHEQEAVFGEEEYHFADEHPDYDVNAAATPETVAAPAAKPLSARLKDSRRILIGIVVFLLLVGVVYRMLVPSGPPSAPAEITKAVPVSAVNTSVTGAATAPPSATVEAALSPVVTSPPAMPPSSAAPAQPEAATAAVMQSPSPAMNDAVNALSARMDSLEQQNTALVNTMQTQYTQKISDLELQESQVRQQLQEMKTQLGAVTDAFHQLSVMLKAEQEETFPGGGMSAGGGQQDTKNRAAAVAANYSVQAIIPGRAWLRSVSGETVTVAEGDVLRKVGRVVRIDPYDGVVSFDDGHGGMVTLTYGQGGDE